MTNLKKALLIKGSSLNYVRKIFRKTNFLTPWYAHVRVRIRGLEMLVFRKILRTYLLDSTPKKYVLHFVNATATQV